MKHVIRGVATRMGRFDSFRVQQLDRTKYQGDQMLE